ncbi:MAG: hypothetical protein AAGA63_05295 [Pseudomonadota bacterium]
MGQHDTSLMTLRRMQKIKAICKTSPDLDEAFKAMRVSARKLSNPISVDLTSRCNLFCEGCYYYEGDAQAMQDEEDEKKWRAFFESERDRNVKFIYVGGAEAALHPERIRAAADNIPYGIIAANGTIKIPKEVNYRIAVSVWGLPDITEKLRGGGTFWKSVRNYARDPRAMFVYTISRQNIDQIRDVVQILSDEGASITFNMYSPTESYLDKLARGAKNDKEFFRVSNQEDNLAFKGEDLAICRDVVDEVVEEFADSIVYPKAFNHEVTVPGPYFTLDSDGIATDCAGRHNGTHKTILSTLTESPNKCCMPNINCAECRLLATVLPSRLMPREKDSVNEAAVRDWINICKYWSWFYLNEPYRPV